VGKMIDALLMAKLFDAAKREGVDMNDPEVQQQLTKRKIQIEHLLISVIEKNTGLCGCKKEETINEDNSRRTR
jgi:hypothetical protein